MIYDWFLEAFSTPTGKAQFISITISSCLAISALFLNQGLTNRRERKKVLVEKVEELYSASMDYLEACDDLVTDIQKGTYREENGYHRYNESTYNKLELSLNKIEMLCGLYFPKAEFKADNYGVKKIPVFWAATSGQIARKEVEPNSTAIDSRKHIEQSSKTLKKMCRDLMKSKMI
jgi:hypothetical protein